MNEGSTSTEIDMYVSTQVQNQTESDVKSKTAFVPLRALNSSAGICVSIHLIGSTLKRPIIVLGRCLTLIHVFHFTLKERQLSEQFLPLVDLKKAFWIAFYHIHTYQTFGI